MHRKLVSEKLRIAKRSKIIEYMKIEYYQPAFFILLAIFVIWFYVDYNKDIVTKAKILRLASQTERFNSENWKHVVPVVKEATMELRLYLGIELPADAATKLKAEADAKVKAEKEERASITASEQERHQEMVSEIVGSIQLAIAPLPKQFLISKADPLSVNAEYAKMIEQKVHEIYPNSTETQCAAICVSARSYLSARGTGLADDVIEDLRDGYHSEEDCPANNQDESDESE